MNAMPKSQSASSSLWTRAMRRIPARRRGSVVILAVAVLAVLAVIALAYVTVVRLERNSVASYRNTVNFHQQVRAVVAEMRALLAADLFGAKVVTNATQTTLRPDLTGSPSTLPRAFEDGDYKDYPSIGTRDRNGERTFNQPTTGNDPPNPEQPSPGAILRVMIPSGAAGGGGPHGPNVPVTGPADDPWLSASTPIDTDGDMRWDLWPQITVLRSGYRLQDTNGDGRKDAWVRGDGRFADLGQFFIQNMNDRGNPAANLMPNQLDDRTVTGFGGFASPQNAPENFALNQPAFQLEKSALAEFQAGVSLAGGYLLDRADERFWADTDHDGFPDARWTQLDSLGDLFGLRWAVAGRIVDNSALANMNAHYAAGNLENPADPRYLGDGLTPADVDLHRLLRLAATSDTSLRRRHPDVDNQITVQTVKEAFHSHMNSVLGFQNPLGAQSQANGLFQINEMNTLNQIDLDSELFHKATDPVGWSFDYDKNTGLSKTQREAYWKFLGAVPTAPVMTRASAYPQGDEVDLRAYWGFNYERVLSKVEQGLDGFPDSDYLPGSSVQRISSYGIMRSKSPIGSDVNWRNPNTAAIEPGGHPAVEKIDRIMRDLRRQLTTVSGASDASPIPSTSVKSKVSIPAIATATGSRKAALLRDAFEAFAWALAPLATPFPTGNTITESMLATLHLNLDAVRDLSYGGGPDGPAKRLDARWGVTGSGASYPILRAASLVVNLADATDEDNNPTITRLFRTPASDNPTTANVFEMGVGFSHGVIDPLLFADTYLGAPPAPPGLGNGVTLVGLDRQPFLREAYSLAVYRYDDIANGPAVTDVEIEPTDASTHMGSIIAIELGNPWPETISVSELRIHMLSDNGAVEPIILEAQGAAFDIPSAGIAVVYFATDSGLSTYGDEVDEMVAAFASELPPGVTLVAVPATQAGAALTTGVVFQGFGNAKAVALTMIQDGVEYLIDRLSPSTPGDFPAVDTTSQTITLTQGNPPRMGSARYAIESSLHRPKEVSSLSGSGFPAYVIERPAANKPAATAFNELPAQEWPLPGSPPAIIDSLAALVSDANRLGQTIGVWPGPRPLDFQFFVPNRPLLFNADIGRLCAYSHMFVHSGDSGGEPAPVVDSASLVFDNLRGPGHWITISEQLGLEENFQYDTTAVNNTYLGTLDFSRYVVGGDLDQTPLNLSPAELPHNLRIPLATRVFDCFEALEPFDGIVNGRVNLNTATREVLEILPFVFPAAWQSPKTSLAIGTLASTTVKDRIAAIMMARDRLESNDTTEPATFIKDELGTTDPQLFTNIQGFRPLKPTNEPLSETRGLVATGELAAMGPWDAGVLKQWHDSSGAGNYGFLALANPFQSANDGGPNLEALDPYQLIENGVYPFDGVNDVEEQLALFRAISNIATTRSDIFTAWFMLRGYEPAAIEAINTSEGTSDAQINSYLNQLEPTFEQRWLVVFDRSNVRGPKDRPRVLLQVELPLDLPLALEFE